MAKTVIINGKTFENVNRVDLPLADGSGLAAFRESSEVQTIPTAAKSITANGTYDVKGYASAQVAVPTEGSTPTLQAKTVTPSTSAQTVEPDSGYDGLSQVTVGAVQVQAKTVTPSTSAQTVEPDTGKYLSKVTVGAVAGEPVLSALGVSPTDVTVPAGTAADGVKSYLTAMSGTYTLTGYTGTLTKDLTSAISSVTVSGTMPTAGSTAAMTVSYGGKSAVVSVTVEAAAPTLTGLSVSYTGGTVAAGTTLAQLTEVVKATYSDGTTSAALTKGTDYTLSGTLTAGQANTVTVTGAGTYAGYSTSFSVTVEAASTGDTTAYTWTTVAAYASLSTLPKTGALALKKTVCNSADELNAATSSDIDLSDTSKTVTITIDGTLYDGDGTVSTEDAGGLLNAQLTRTNGVWAMNWMEFQEGGTRHTTFSTADPCNVTITGSSIAIYAGKRIWSGNEYAMKFTTNKASHRVDYKITVEIA